MSISIRPRASLDLHLTVSAPFSNNGALAKGGYISVTKIYVLWWSENKVIFNAVPQALLC